MVSNSKPREDLTVVIPALNEAENLAVLLPDIHRILSRMNICYSIVVVDEHADDKTRQVVAQNHAVLLSPPTRGYANALRAGFDIAACDYLVTMDADYSHPPDFLRDLWESRDTSGVIIASRYIAGGKAIMPRSRYILSKILNLVFSRGLDLAVKDMSSGYRLYNFRTIKPDRLRSDDFDVLQELLVYALGEGYTIHEIPFCYQPRREGSSHARVLKFGLAYLRTFTRLWKYRNSILNADYDYRAYNASLPPQRYWQRQRFKHVVKLVAGQGRCLDVGCGSSRIISALPEGSIGLDILIRKLRFSRRFGSKLVQGSGFDLPFGSETFPCVLSSQLIEHLPHGRILDELDRVLQPGGCLVLGTPDYDKWQWRLIERIYGIVLPQAYADEHITHYTYKDLYNEFVGRRGYQLEATRYILQGELIMALRKPPREAEREQG
ncbi:MAG: glycosyltransferase [Chloroflexota bacterium]|nr:MAG: glycosyltransferase [Chloroflexota bacterium]